jgi:mRNA interferase RelE/StbE
VIYRVILKPVARKELRKLFGKEYTLITETLSSIAENPRSGDVKQLSGFPLWRRRAGNFRIIFSIDDERHLLYVVRIVIRNEKTYRNL